MRLFNSLLPAYALLGAPTVWANGLFTADTVNLPGTTDGQDTLVSVQFSDPFDTAPVVVLTPNDNNPNLLEVMVKGLLWEM